MDKDHALEQIRTILAQAEEDYLYEAVDDDPPAVDWAQLTAAICAVVEQLPATMHAIQ